MPSLGHVGHWFSVDFKTANRNRFVVHYAGHMWNVCRIGHKGGVVLIMSFHDKELALRYAAQFNGLFARREIT